MKKTVSLILSVIILILSLCSCSGNDNSAIIYYGIGQLPTTLDAQLASSVTELTIVKNIYEGLVRENESGKIVPAVAKSYEKNGNTYIFNISENAVWNNGEPVTADDFVFALTRALDPITKAPDASSLFSIKNAEKYNSGIKTELGISAIDSKTLKIELEYDNEDFLSVLTTSVCMPCNRSFFEKCTGKYGMSADTVLSNGSYKLTKWNTEAFAMRLYKSGKYSGNFVSKAAAVFISYDENEAVLQRITNGTIDIGEIENNEIEKAKSNGLNTVCIPNTVWLLNIGNGYSEKLKNSLVYSLAVYNTSVSDYPEGITPAHSIYPELFNKNDSIDVYNIKLAQNLYNTEIKGFSESKLPVNTLYYYNSGNSEALVKIIVGHWQQNLGAYINIEAVNKNSAVAAKKSDYSLTVYSEQINVKNDIKYADFFGLSNADNLKSEIFSGNTFPIAYSGSVFAYSDKLQKFENNTVTGIIDFTFITKNN